jgi:cyanate lyase
MAGDVKPYSRFIFPEKRETKKQKAESEQRGELREGEKCFFFFFPAAPTIYRLSSTVIVPAPKRKSLPHEQFLGIESLIRTFR